MARALARGWGRPVLCTDALPERAGALAAEIGGEALASNAELAERADLVVLCHKPAQLEPVAARGRAAGPGGRLDPRRPRRWPPLRGGLPRPPGLPRAAQHARRGAPGRDRAAPATTTQDAGARPGRRATSSPSSARSSSSTTRSSTSPMALMSCAPAYVALVAEAQVDAGVRARPARRQARPSSSSRRSPARPSCCAAATSTRWRCAARSPRPAAPPPAGWPRSSAAACARPSRTRSTRRWPDLDAGRRDRSSSPRRATRSRLRLGGALRLHAADHRLHPDLAVLRLRRARAVLAVVERAPRLPARRLRAVPGHLPALHPADRPAGLQPDRGDPRRCRSSAGSSSSLIRG